MKVVVQIPCLNEEATLPLVLKSIPKKIPGGIGVRELVLAFFSITSTVIVTWRLITFSMDMTLGFFAIVYLNRVKTATGQKTSVGV